MSDTSALEAARRIKVAMNSIKGKRLPIKFPDDETAMVFSCIIENAGRVTRAYLDVCEWRDISSAPKDDSGQEFLVSDGFYMAVAHHINGEWRQSYTRATPLADPTHWKPLGPLPCSSEPISAGSMPNNSSGADRDAVIEECAAVADEWMNILTGWHADEKREEVRDRHAARANLGVTIAKEIRALKSPPTVG